MSAKLTCIIADDEPAALEQMRRYAEKTPFLDVRGVFSNGFDVLEYLQANAAPQLIFLDIQMPELNGMELSKMLPRETRIIFTTAFDKYAIEGYKVNALDYLLKPIDYSEFLSAANRARESFAVTAESIAAKSETTENYIFIKSEHKQLKVWLNNILYIEGLKDYVKIYTTNDSKPILSLMSLKKLEDVLPATLFMRIHRSFIVALNNINHIERNQVITGDQRITVADQYKATFQAFLDKKSL